VGAQDLSEMDVARKDQGRFDSVPGQLNREGLRLENFKKTKRNRINPS
jgi:hypothetical protein